MFWAVSNGSVTPKRSAVAGISCINPWAFAELTASARPADSTEMTASASAGDTRVPTVASRIAGACASAMSCISCNRGGAHVPRTMRTGPVTWRLPRLFGGRWRVLWHARPGRKAGGLFFGVNLHGDTFACAPLNHGNSPKGKARSGCPCPAPSVGQMTMQKTAAKQRGTLMWLTALLCVLAKDAGIRARIQKNRSGAVRAVLDRVYWPKVLSPNRAFSTQCFGGGNKFCIRPCNGSEMV